MPDKCECVDFQILKLQETPDAVPQGEMPRHMQLFCDRYLCEKVVPGNRVTILGIYSIKKVGKAAKVFFCFFFVFVFHGIKNNLSQKVFKDERVRETQLSCYFCRRISSNVFWMLINILSVIFSDFSSWENSCRCSIRIHTRSWHPSRYSRIGSQ